MPLIAALSVASATAADPQQLTGQRLNSGFYPCPDQTELNRAPFVNECTNPPATNVTASCDPEGVSTITVTRTGNALGQPPLLNGTYTETITASIGPQGGPPKAAFAPFVGNGMQVGSTGLATGELLSFHSDFTITTGDTTVEGTRDLAVSNAGNWGVCLGPLTEEPVGGTVFGQAPLTGHFHMVSAGVLAYEATITGPGGTTTEDGVAETYLQDTFATCCNSASPSNVSSASGQLASGFGTTHPEEGTSGEAETEPGETEEPVTVEPLGGLEITFSDVTAGGTTTAVLATSLPDPPPNAYQVGDPPAFYEITTTAGFEPPITVCLPYGALPADDTDPVLLHYVDGAWEEARNKTFTLVPAVVCGEVDSLSPFAAVFLPVSPPDRIAAVRSSLEEFLTPPGTKVADKVEDVIAKLDAALAKLATSPPDRKGAAGELEGAAGDLEAAMRSRLLTSAQATPHLTEIADIGRALAEDAIADAVTRGGSAAKIQAAQSALAVGDARLASGRYKDAIARYKDAIAKADGA